MAGALRQMLTAANLPVNLETAQLVQRALELQNNLEEATGNYKTASKVALDQLSYY